MTATVRNVDPGGVEGVGPVIETGWAGLGGTAAATVFDTETAPYLAIGVMDPDGYAVTVLAPDDVRDLAEELLAYYDGVTQAFLPAAGPVLALVLWAPA